MTERVPSPLATGAILTLTVPCAVGVAMSSPMLRAARGIVAVAVGALVLRNACRHARLAHALAADSRPGRIASVLVRWRPLASHAGVAGLRRPTIFCDPDLTRRLTADEVRAVALHERGHQQRRDPLRLVALASLDPLLRWLPGGRQWLERRRGELEIRADHHALRNGATRPALVRALLQLAGDDPPTPAAAGFVSAMELRLRALLNCGPALSRRGGWRRAALTATAVAAVCLLAAGHHSWLSAAAGIGCVLAGC